MRFDTPTPFEEWDPEEKAAKMKIEQLELQLKGAQMEHDGLRLQRLAQLGEFDVVLVPSTRLNTKCSQDIQLQGLMVRRQMRMKTKMRVVETKINIFLSLLKFVSRMTEACMQRLATIRPESMISA